MDDAMDCLMSFSDFLFAFQVQFYYSGESLPGPHGSCRDHSPPLPIPPCGPSVCASGPHFLRRLPSWRASPQDVVTRLGLQGLLTTQKATVLPTGRGTHISLSDDHGHTTTDTLLRGAPRGGSRLVKACRVPGPALGAFVLTTALRGMRLFNGEADKGSCQCAGLTRGPAPPPARSAPRPCQRGRRSLPGPDADVSTQLPISARQSPLTRPPHPLLPSKLQLHPEIPGGIKMAGWIPAHTGSHTAASDGMLGPETADCVHQQTCFKQALPVNRAGCPGSLPVAFRQRLAPAGPDLTQGPHRVLSRAAPGPGQAGAAVWGLASCSQQLRASMSHFSEALGPWRRSSRVWRPYSPHHVNGLSSQRPPERAAMGRWAVSLSSPMRARRLTPEN